MFLKVLHLYPRIMDLYGDVGNLVALRYRATARDIKVSIEEHHLGEQRSFADYDIIFLGGGSDLEQTIVSKELLRERENLKQALDQGTFFLLICGAYQLFGQYYLDQHGRRIPGLGFWNFYTQAGSQRMLGNVVVEMQLEGESYLVLGFENHAGATFLEEGHPLGKVLLGYGNNLTERVEGFWNSQVLGTYLHGPLLSKNPRLTDYLLQQALRKRYGTVTLFPLDDQMEIAARTQLLARWGIYDKN